MAFEYVPNADGTVDIPAVPIMRLHEDEDFVCDAAWVGSAIDNHVSRKKEGGNFLPSVTIGHNKKDDDTERETIGFFDNLRLQGNTVLCDFVHIDKEVAGKLRKGRLPNRSVELLPKSKMIPSIALLGGTSPYFALAQMRKMGEEVHYYFYSEKEKNMARKVRKVPVGDLEEGANEGEEPIHKSFTFKDEEEFKMYMKRFLDEFMQDVLSKSEDGKDGDDDDDRETVTSQSASGPALRELKEVRREYRKLEEAHNTLQKEVRNEGVVSRALRVKLHAQEIRDELKEMRRSGVPIGDDEAVEKRVKFCLRLADGEQVKLYMDDLGGMPKVPVDQDLEEGSIERSGEELSEEDKALSRESRDKRRKIRKYAKDNDERLRLFNITEDDLILSEEMWGTSQG